MLNLIGCASLWYAVICSKSGRIRQFPGLDTPRFKEVSGDRIFLATEKVRIGENTVPDTRRTRRVSWNMILPDLPVFSKNTGPYRGISGPRHVFFHAVFVSINSHVSESTYTLYIWVMNNATVFSHTNLQVLIVTGACMYYITSPKKQKKNCFQFS